MCTTLLDSELSKLQMIENVFYIRGKSDLWLLWGCNLLLVNCISSVKYCMDCTENSSSLPVLNYYVLSLCVALLCFTPAAVAVIPTLYFSSSLIVVKRFYFYFFKGRQYGLVDRALDLDSDSSPCFATDILCDFG